MDGPKPDDQVECLIAWGRQQGRAVLQARLKDLNEQCATLSGTGMEGLATIRPRIIAAQVALDRDDGIAAAYLATDIEKKIAALHHGRLAPLAEKHVNSVNGLQVARQKRVRNSEEKWNECLAVLDRLDRSIGEHIKYDERWKMLAAAYLPEVGDSLEVAAAQKRLPKWRKSSGRLAQTSD